MKFTVLTIAAVALVLLGAGCNTEQTHVVIATTYDQVSGNVTQEEYVQKLYEYVSDSSNAVDVVVTSGGYLHSKDISDAQSLATYFDSIADEKELSNSGIQSFTEECSVAYFQQIANTKKLLDKEGVKPTKITLFGDVARKEQLLAYTLYQFTGSDGLPTNPLALAKFAADPSITTVQFQEHNFGTENVEIPDTVDKIVAAFDNPDVAKEELKSAAKTAAEKVDFDVVQTHIDKGCLGFSELTE